MGHWAGLLAHTTEQLTIWAVRVHFAEYIELYNQLTTLVYTLQRTLYNQQTFCSARVHCEGYNASYNRRIPCTMYSVFYELYTVQTADPMLQAPVYTVQSTLHFQWSLWILARVKLA